MHGCGEKTPKESFCGACWVGLGIAICRLSLQIGVKGNSILRKEDALFSYSERPLSRGFLCPG